MRTITEIANSKHITELQKLMILGFCNDAKIITEEDLNLRKIHNRKILTQCIRALNNSGRNTLEPDKPYLNVVGSPQEVRTIHDIYIVSTTFGLRFYTIESKAGATPYQKLVKMLSIRMNNLDTCFMTGGKHHGLPLFYTGLLLAYVPHKYYKTNTYEFIKERYNGYRETV